MHNDRSAHDDLFVGCLAVAERQSHSDPGLQAERTSLAWTRTASSLLLNAVLFLRSGYVNSSMPLIVLSSALVFAAGATFVLGSRRRIDLMSGEQVECVPEVAARFITAVTLLAAIAGGLAIASKILPLG